MAKAHCCENMGLKKGPWTPEEDRILISYIQLYGHGNWRALPKQAGLLRCGKSCRLRWKNYLRPDIKRGNFSKQEEETIIKLHQVLGNRWSAIAAKLPGRTDNEIKNFWHSHLKKRLKQNSATPASSKQDVGKVTVSYTPGTSTSTHAYPPFSSCQQPQKVLGSQSDSTNDCLMARNVFEPRDCPLIGRGHLSPLSPDPTKETMNNSGSYLSDGMDFWYKLFTKSGELVKPL